jgi:hypothetical protein
MKKIFTLMLVAGTFAIVSCGEGKKDNTVVDTVVIQDITVTDSNITDNITVILDTVTVNN